MKKIAFFVQQMLCGGVETSLLALVEQLQKEKKDLEITIYTVMEKGELLSCIPNGIQLKKIPIPSGMEKYLAIGGIKHTVREQLDAHHYGRAAVSTINYIFGTSSFAELNIRFDSLPVLEEKFDIAVNYHMHSPFLVRYLAQKVAADKKYTWIHNDFSTTKYRIDKLREYLEECDGFYGVSQKLVAEFTGIFPQYSDKTYLFPNIIPADVILKKSMDSAEQYEENPDGKMRILTVGRLEEQKGYDLAVAACQYLVDEGYQFQWLVIGEGTQRTELEKLIKKNKLENNFLLLGARINPYPFFRLSDLYVQTSRHEGCSIAIAEAKCFELPIICTNCAGADELINNGENGYITNINAREIAERIAELITKPEIREKFRKNLRQDNKKQEMIIPKEFLGGL